MHLIVCAETEGTYIMHMREKGLCFRIELELTGHFKFWIELRRLRNFVFGFSFFTFSTSSLLSIFFFFMIILFFMLIFFLFFFFFLFLFLYFIPSADRKGRTCFAPCHTWGAWLNWQNFNKGVPNTDLRIGARLSLLLGSLEL